MANSTTNIDTISAGQASKEVTANAYFDASSQAATYGRRMSTSSGLAWGFYGGNVLLSGGSLTQVANGTVTLTASTTNYIVAAKSNGAVTTSTATTNWNDDTNYWRLYSVLTGASTVTSYVDNRLMGSFTVAPTGGGAAAWGSITGTLSAQTDLQAELNLKLNAASPSSTGTLTHDGDFVISGVARRIIGDFSNATFANRVAFQTSTVNGSTVITAIPNGTGTTSGLGLYSNADPDNSSRLQLSSTPTSAVITIGPLGTGASVPLIVSVGGAERLRIDATTGSVLATSTGGLGYGPGAGGTVTQATSKGTSVVLNKPCGRITTHNASLAAGAAVVFTFTNSLITSGDTVVVCAENNANYRIECVYTTTGAAGIRIVNVTGVAQAEAVGINFTIKKGATS
jgi:hypothetical protein